MAVLALWRDRQASVVTAEVAGPEHGRARRRRRTLKIGVFGSGGVQHRLLGARLRRLSRRLDDTGSTGLARYGTISVANRRTRASRRRRSEE